MTVTSIDTCVMPISLILSFRFEIHVSKMYFDTIKFEGRNRLSIVDNLTGEDFATLLQDENAY